MEYYRAGSLSDILRLRNKTVRELIVLDCYGVLQGWLSVRHNETEEQDGEGAYYFRLLWSTTGLALCLT